MLELEAALEATVRARGDVEKNYKRFQQQIRDLELVVEEEQAATQVLRCVISSSSSSRRRRRVFVFFGGDRGIRGWYYDPQSALRRFSSRPNTQNPPVYAKCLYICVPVRVVFIFHA